MLIRKGYNKLLIVPGLKQSLGGCGKKVRIAYDCDFKANSNIFIGDYSQIGPHALFWTTRAKIRIGNYVLLGPSVTIITGNHRTDVIGRHIAEVREEEKLPDNDGDIVVKDGAWIGANVTILKGVTIGEGCVIAAGSVVTKSTDEYSVYAGVPAKKIKERFTAEELQKHKEMIANRLKE
ncbi:MAG: acyltransferase [Lachnospiraceae bacterium]|nr:acyltransferase [Lachnospiraceae bacterium]